MKIEDKFKDYWIAVEEIDSLISEGFFGEEVKALDNRRELIDISDYLSECIDLWINDTDQYGKEKIKGLILVFLKLYSEAIQSGGQIAINVLTAFWKGFPKNPETECLSSYTEFARSRIENKSLFKQIRAKRSVTNAERKKYANSLLETYQEGVEFIGKMLTICILLRQITNGEKIEPMKIYVKSLGKKTEQFLELSDRKYDVIINSIDRDIRNAKSHLDIRFVPVINAFYLKTKKNDRIISKKITTEQMVLQIFPKVVWVIQAFVYASALLVICGKDKNKYKEMINKIYY